MMPPHQLAYFIRVTNIDLFNVIVTIAEDTGRRFKTARSDGYYVLRTDDETLWRELYLYGQMLAQAQDTFLDAGEESK